VSEPGKEYLCNAMSQKPARDRSKTAQIWARIVVGGCWAWVRGSM